MGYVYNGVGSVVMREVWADSIFVLPLHVSPAKTKIIDELKNKGNIKPKNI